MRRSNNRWRVGLSAKAKGSPHHTQLNLCGAASGPAAVCACTYPCTRRVGAGRSWAEDELCTHQRYARNRSVVRFCRCFFGLTASAWYYCLAPSKMTLSLFILALALAPAATLATATGCCDCILTSANVASCGGGACDKVEECRQCIARDAPGACAGCGTRGIDLLGPP